MWRGWAWEGCKRGVRMRLCRASRLRGEAIAERIGFDRSSAPAGLHAFPSVVAQAPVAPGAARSHADSRADSGSEALCSDSSASASDLGSVSTAGAQESILDFSLEDARRLPPFVLMSSLPDVTVPW